MSSTAYHLIHANVALAKAPLDDPAMAGFLQLAEEIDALAAASPGFVAQPSPPDEGEVYTGRALLNLSIWESSQRLDDFTHAGQHALALARRREWFDAYEGPNYVLFWAPAGHVPAEAEVKGRLEHLARHGPTPWAFTFERRFTLDEMIAYSRARG